MPRRRPCLAPLPAPLGLRFRALLGLGFVPPPEPRPCVHCASIAYALLPAGRVPLCRHRADPESSSRSLPSGSPARIAPPIAPTARRRSHRAHRAPTSASPPHLSPRVAAAPGPWLARTAPYASLFRRMREKGPLPGNIRPKCMLFEIKMATSSPHASISGRNRAIQDTWRANLAAKGPFSRRGARNHAWREDVASAARPFRGSGLRSGGTGFAPCGSGMRHAAWPNGLCALRRGPGPPRPAPPAISPAFIVAVLHVSCFAARIASTAPSHPPRRPLWSGRAVDQALPAALVLPTPRQPNPGPEPTGPRPPVEPSAPTRAPPRLTLLRGSRCGSGNSREMVR